MENVDPSFTGNQTDQADHGETTILASRENLAPHILKTQMATLTGVVTAQVNVAQEQLPAFLKTAEKLKIKGLAEGTQGSDN